MLTETLSGKCPCCSYDKLIQRYGSQGYYQLDGCPNCGFGYGHAMGQESESAVGEDAWLDFAKTLIASAESDKYNSMFADDSCIIREGNSIAYNGGETKEHKSCSYALNIIHKLPKEELRIKIFEWAEKQDRSDDIDTTVFKYTEDDINNYLSTNPKIFKQIPA